MASKPTPTKTKKTKRSTTRAASTTPKAAAKKSAPKATVVSTKKPEGKSIDAAAPTSAKVDAPELTKKEMVERMVSNTGMKKGEARRALEASMEALGQALREGYNLSLAPLGKIKIARTKDTPNGKMVVLRTKLKDPVASVPKDPMSEAAE
ncbi:HU family DNA-binding protein [uncultured Litoreibacter sp.]|uniref:HU family DNA-binding protein n=1 Tax=uncultured Litoreibacter sp. TaxID=1392394 RepID=UPI0026046B00|nr:HU family DNA-binding protein [uncultured Litoreibacter sp.]